MTDKITPAELDVLEELWRASPAAASDIAERLEHKKSWSAQTVKTLLARLVEKGAASFEQDGRRYLYRPTVSKEQYARKEARWFVDRLFDGRTAPLVANLAGSGKVTREDIAELEALLKELKRERK